MRKTYEAWAIEVLGSLRKCKVENAMRCIPLRLDPICKQCYEDERETKETSE